MLSTVFMLFLSFQDSAYNYALSLPKNRVLAPPKHHQTSRRDTVGLAKWNLALLAGPARVTGQHCSI